jgi:hypothetical protein
MCDLCSMQVPGLAENRPSVLRGDCLFVTRSDGSTAGTQWEGYVHHVDRDEVGVISCAVWSHICHTKCSQIWTRRRPWYKVELIGTGQLRPMVMHIEHSKQNALDMR